MISDCRLYSCLGLDSAVTEDLLLTSPEANGSPSTSKAQKKIHQVSQSDNPTKITIKTFEVPSTHQDHPRPGRKRRQKEFASPNSDSRIFVVSHDPTKTLDDHPQTSSNVKVPKPSANPQATTSKQAMQEPSIEVTNDKGGSDSGKLPMCSITISFDLNTQKLWDDLHLPYETYTSFFRHLILLEKYFRNGDLALSENASQKASSYIRSLQNRIEEYEVKHKRSHSELSASTRPDLSVPPAPTTGQITLPIIEPPSTRQRTSAERESSPVPSTSSSSSCTDTSTILKIPKVSMPSTTPPQVSSPPMTSMPTKIRVRSDLTYIGLMPKGQDSSGNSGESKKGHQQELSNQVKASSSSSASVHQNQSLMQLLTDPTLKQKATNSNQGSNKGPTLGKTSLVGNSSSSVAGSSSKSSNSQLFKNSEASGSSAIPLTFNNSIAEVLAAAAKSKSLKSNQQSDSNKPEVTITSKSYNPKPSWTMSNAGDHTNLKQKPSSSQNSMKNINPLMDMSKLLQQAAPGIPPHIVAQNTLAMPTTGSMTKPVSTHPVHLPKIAPKPTASLLRPTSSPTAGASGQKPGNPSGITQVNKKSLNTVLDRLSGLKNTSGSSFPITSSSANSSLVQQLQAPPIVANPGGLTSPSSSKGNQIQRASTSSGASSSGNSSGSSVAANLQSLQTLMASQGLLGFPGAPQPMIQYPYSAQQAASAWAEAQRVLSLAGAGAGLPGVNQAAASAAQHEIMKMILQQSQQQQTQSSGNKPGNNSQSPQLPRPRAPPPLTLMGRAGGVQNPPSKSHQKPE